MNIQTRPLAIAAALALAASHPALAATRFVDAGLASGANDGSSWANAHRGSRQRSPRRSPATRSG